MAKNTTTRIVLKKWFDTDTTVHGMPTHSKNGVSMFSENPDSDHQSARLLPIQKQVLEKIVGGNEIYSILNEICLEIEKVLPGSLCTIQAFHQPTGSLHTKCGPSISSSLYEDLDQSLSHHSAHACALAIHSRYLATSVNDGTDPSWGLPSTVLNTHGIQAIWSIPIFSKDKNVTGTVTILHREPRRPLDFDLQALDTASHLASLALHRHTEVQELQANKERFQNLFDSAPIAYFSSNMSGMITSANTCTAEITGRPQEELRGTSLLDLFSSSIRGKKKAERIHQWLSHGIEVEGEELELQRRDGTRRWVRLAVRLVRDAMGTPLEYRGILEDISNRKQAEHLLDEQKSILEMIARGQPLRLILSRLCQGIETLSPELKCSVHQLKGTTLHFLAGPSLPKAYVNKTTTIEIGPAVGSCGTAAYRREAVVVSDIATDPLWNRVRNLALRHDLRACWSLPIFSSDNEVLGTMAMYYPQPRTPCREDWEMIESVKKLVGIALEQDRDRAALKQSEARLRQVIDLVPHFIFAKDQTGRFILANQAIADVYGTTVQELMGKKDEDFTQSPHEAKHFRHDDLEVLSTGKAKTLEEYITDSNNKVRYLHTTKIPFRFADTLLPSILGVAIDITDRKQGEEALRLTQHVFDILPDNVSVVGPDYRYRRVNPVYEQVHGMPAHQLIGTHIADLLGKDVFEYDIKPFFDRCLAGEIVSFEQWFTFRDGKKRFMAVTYSPLRSKDHPDTVDAVVVNARDLTSRKQIEEALKESEEHLRILLDERIRISQDLHDHVLQSLYAVGLIIAAIRKPLENQNFSEVHEFLHQAVAQVNNSICEIRGFIEGLPQDVRDIQDFTTELHGLAHSMSLPDGPTFQLRINQDAAKLLSKQEILHLLSIARESMSNCLRHAQASRGTIRLTKKRDHLEFEIHDNGIGFNHQSPAQTGHGLINMKARAEHLHGALIIRSALSKGTRVIIHIPIRNQRRGK